MAFADGLGCLVNTMAEEHLGVRLFVAPVQKQVFSWEARHQASCRTGTDCLWCLSLWYPSVRKNLTLWVLNIYKMCSSIKNV